jgi:YVTN family beta-propeller protein
MQSKILFRWLLVLGLGLVVTVLLISLPAIVQAQQGRMPGEGDSRRSPELQTGSLFLLEVAPPAFEVTLTPGALLVQTMTITNIGSGTLTFTIAELPGDVPWLSENPTSESLSVGEALPVEVTFDASGLTPGSYTTTLVVATNQTGDSPAMVPVTMTVTGPSVIYLPLIMKNFSPSPMPLPCAPERLADIFVGNQPRGLAVDEARTRVYVANQASASVSIVDGHSNAVIKTVTNFPAISAPNGIAYDPATDTIWVGNAGSENGVNTYWLAPINASTFAVGTPVPVGREPWGIIFNPVDKLVYVANQGDNTVSVISPTLNSVVKTVGVGQRPYNLAVHRGTGLVYVANFGAKSVSALGPGGSFLFNIPLDFGSDEPFGIAVDDVLDNYVYVSTVKSHRIETIDIDNGHQLLPWHEFRRLNGHGVPLRALALNLTLDTADGGHLWTTTSTTDMSDATQVLLIPKGYRSGFSRPVPDDYEDPTGGGLISAGIAVDTVIDRTYVSLPASAAVRVFGDRDGACVLPFLADDKSIVVSGP